MYRLEERHLEEAKKIALKNRKRKRFDNCYERGYIGLTQQNLLVPCTKCVDIDKLMEEWKAYVAQFPDLKEEFSDLWEEEGEETEKENV